MIKSFGLENFRVFKEKTDFDLAPITIITGPNNSGKSSLIRSIQLLSESATNFKFDQLSFWQTKTNYYSEKCLLSSTSDKSTIGFSLFLKIKEPEPKYDELLISDLRIDLSFNFKDTPYGQLEKMVIKNAKTDTICYNLKVTSEGLIINTNTEWLFERIKKSWNDKDSLSMLTSEQKEEIKKRITDIISKKFARIKGGSKSFNLSDKLKDTLFFMYDYETDNQDPVGANYYSRKIVNDLFLPSSDKIEAVQKEIEYLINNSFHSLFDYVNEITDDCVRTMRNTYLTSNFREAPKRSITPQEDHILISTLKPYLDKNLDINDHIDFSKDILKNWFGFTEALTISKDKNNYIEIKVGNTNIADMGYGIYQLIILLLTIDLADEKSVLLIEEPELNLHPKFQSLLADVFIDSIKIKESCSNFYNKNGYDDIRKLKTREPNWSGFYPKNNRGHQLIIETHSEYIIHRMQYLVAKKLISPEDVIIYYIDNREGEKVRALRIKENGELDGEFGEGFLDESANLIFKLWEVRGLN